MSLFQTLFIRLKKTRLQKLFHAPMLPVPNAGATPRIIWMYWEQGLEAAPAVVHRCHDSWAAQNPDWELRFLDAASVSDWVDLTDLSPDIPRETRADLLRLRLLVRHGGVWADATLLCTTPLDHWLHLVLPTGSFFFQRPRPERVMANWFMAARSEAPLISAIEAAATQYWQDRKTADTYFWFHFTVEYLLRTNSDLRRDFAAMPALSAEAPLRLQRYLRGKDEQAPDLVGLPLHKLTWRDEIDLDAVQLMLNNGI